MRAAYEENITNRPHTALSLVSLVSIERSTDFSQQENVTEANLTYRQIPRHSDNTKNVSAAKYEETKTRYAGIAENPDEEISNASTRIITRNEATAIKEPRDVSAVTKATSVPSSNKRKVSFCFDDGSETVSDIRVVSDANFSCLPGAEKFDSGLVHQEFKTQTAVHSPCNATLITATTAKSEFTPSRVIPISECMGSFQRVDAGKSNEVQHVHENVPICQSAITAWPSHEIYSTLVEVVESVSPLPIKNETETSTGKVLVGFSGRTSTMMAAEIVPAASHGNTPARSTSFRNRLRHTLSLNNVDLWEDEEVQDDEGYNERCEDDAVLASKLHNNNTDMDSKSEHHCKTDIVSKSPRIGKTDIVSKSFEAIGTNSKSISLSRESLNIAAPRLSTTARRRASVPLSSEKSISSLATSIWSASTGAASRRSFDISWPCVRVIDADQNVRTIPLDLYSKKTNTEAVCVQKLQFERGHALSIPSSFIRLPQQPVENLLNAECPISDEERRQSESIAPSDTSSEEKKTVSMPREYLI